MPRRLVAVALLSSVLGGCGYSLSGPAPNRPRNQLPECDTSKSLVVIDALMATALGVATLSTLNTDEPAVALLPLSLGAIYLGGAIKGTQAVNACNKARSEFEELDSDLLADDDETPRRKQPRKPSEVLPQIGYTPTPYPGQGQPAYSPVNTPASPPPQYTAPTPGPAPVAQPPIAQPPVAPTPVPAAPQPPVAQPARPQPARPATPPRVPPRTQPADDGDWSDFWREVP